MFVVLFILNFKRCFFSPSGLREGHSFHSKVPVFTFSLYSGIWIVCHDFYP